MLKVNNESQAKRCEICHQTDCFDGNRSFCSRCNGAAPQQQTKVDPQSNQRPHVKINSHQQFVAVPTKVVIQPSYSQKFQMAKWIAPGLIGIYVLLYLEQTLVKFNSTLVSGNVDFVISWTVNFLMVGLAIALLVKVVLASHAKGSFKRSYKQ